MYDLRETLLGPDSFFANISFYLRLRVPRQSFSDAFLYEKPVKFCQVFLKVKVVYRVKNISLMYTQNVKTIVPLVNVS